MWKAIIFSTILGYAFGKEVATVYLRDPDGVNNVTGTVTFTKTSNGVSVEGVIRGLEPGNHGFHIHSLGNINSACIGTGGHFNPHNATHGDRNDKTRHVGDLGNVNVTSSGIVNFSFVDTVIDLKGQHNIIGRAVVVHQGEDDLGKGGGDSLINGNAGARLACGVIGILEEGGDGKSSAVITTASYSVIIAVSVLSYGWGTFF